MSHYPPPDEQSRHHHELRRGTRVTIELEGRYVRGRGSVDEYLEQTAIANPHVTIHYVDPDGGETTYSRSTTQLPPEPVEIKPHPYGIELGQLVTMLKSSHGGTISQFLTTSFSRVSSGLAQRICEAAKVSTRANPHRIGRQEADALYVAIQNTKIPPPATNCISPIGEALILKGLHHQLPGEFFCAATRPPAVYRGNPFVIEVGLAYGGASPTQKVTLEALAELLQELQGKYALAYLFIAHDLAVVEHISRRVIVMYLGKVVEMGAAKVVCRQPKHPYTQALISAVPVIDPASKRKRIVLFGDVPSPIDPPQGCPFHPRCPVAESRCRTDVPPLRELGLGHFTACHSAQA